MARWLPALLLAGCQPGPDPVDAGLPCGERPDTVVVRPVLCGADVPDGGDGGVGDWLIAGPELRVIVRDEQAALTTLGVGGGTVIDAAPWGLDDQLHELIPLGAEAWLRDVEIAPLADGLAVRGARALLPELPDAPADAEPVEVVYRVDGASLVAEGAEALLIRAHHTARVEEGRFVGGGVTYGSTARLDLSGAAPILRDDRVLVAPSADALTALNPQGRPAAGVAPGAEALEILVGDAIVATVPVDDAFDLRVPADADGVRAVADGRAPSVVRPPGVGLDLAVGARGQVRVEPLWRARAHPVRVRWTGSGLSGRAVVGPRGGVVATGPGEVRLLAYEADGEPTVELLTAVPEDGEATVEPELRGIASERVDVVWRGRGEHSDRLPALTDAEGHEAAAATGAALVVLMGDNRVATAPGDPASFLPGLTTGARLALADGAILYVWPLSASPRRAGLGAPDVLELPAVDAIAAVGADRRRVAVDVQTLGSLGPPWAVDPRPTHVVLGEPGPDGPVDGAWAPLWAWIDAGVPLVPLGDRVLVEVADPDRASATDAEVALVRGRAMASTGPEIWLDVGDAGPGEVVGDLDGHGAKWESEAPVARLSLPDPWREQARALLIVDGVSYRQWRAVDAPAEVRLPGDARWASLVVWEAPGGADQPWAVTAPVWIRPPPWD